MRDLRTGNVTNDDRAESWERADPDMGQEVLFSQSAPFYNVSRTHGPVAESIPTKGTRLAPDWRPLSIYSDAIQPSHEPTAPKDTILEDHNDAPTPDSKDPALAIPPQETVQPHDIFRPLVAPLTEVRNNAPPLKSILLAPVGAPESAIKFSDRATAQPAVHPSKVTAPTKAAKLKYESATDATITEAIVAALARTGVQENAKDCSLHHDMKTRSLPHGQASSGTSDPHASKDSTERSDGHTNDTSNLAVKDDTEFLQQEKAREVLKTLQELGFTVQKDPGHSVKLQNPGSAASNKSDKVVTCQTCKRFTGRPCELKYVFPCSFSIMSNKLQKTHETSLSALWLHIHDLQQNLWQQK